MSNNGLNDNAVWHIGDWTI